MKEIEKLVSNLPEVYQPIYGYPQLSTEVSRISTDRLVEIETIYKALEADLHRPLKVLDLGCAQGFFSLSLASLGAEVVGLDYCQENVELCQALAKNANESNIRFIYGKIEEFISSETFGSYDLVLGLSVFHHLIHEYGQDYVANIVNQLSATANALILEFALAEEPLYWAGSQPKDFRVLFSQLSFVNEVGQFSTHLSEIKRPFFFASNVYLFLSGQVFSFHRSTTSSHALADNVYQGTRTYYFSGKYVAKVFDIEDVTHGEKNLKELNNEVDFLKNPPQGFSSPKVLLFGSNAKQAWSVIDRLPGELLLDILIKEKPVDIDKVLFDVLSQLVTLEKAGLYHNDVRAWNILIQDSGNARIIDFGSISKTKTDCVWPNNLFLSFIIFVNELISRKVDNYSPIRQVSISPYGFVEPYRSWLLDFWGIPQSQWTFEYLLQSFVTNIRGVNTDNEVDVNADAVWMEAIERGLDTQKEYSFCLEGRLKHIETSIHKSDVEVGQAEVRVKEAEGRAIEAEVRAKEADVRVKEAEVRAKEAEVRAKEAEVSTKESEAELNRIKFELNSKEVEEKSKMLELELRAKEAESKSQELISKLDAVYASSSWMIATPFRVVKTQLMKIKSLFYLKHLFLKLKKVRLVQLSQIFTFLLKTKFLKSIYLTIVGFLPHSIQAKVNAIVLRLVTKIKKSAVVSPKPVLINHSRFNSKFIDRLDKNFAMIYKK